jgi:hypothetical protein
MDINLTQPSSPGLFCSELSSEAGESMVGTAPAVKAWFLLEYAGVWTAKAIEDNDLLRPVQDWLKEQLSLVESGRVQFIKQNRPGGAAGITFFVALTREVRPLLYQFRLDGYQDLFRLDVPALLSGSGAYDEFLRAEPLYLVCSNGKRDRCCSRVGLTLFQALAKRVGESAWQCTHLAGHRFAPTLVAFPDGTYYGRLAPQDLAPFVAAQEREELYLSHLRGRSCYDEVTQAADQFLRRETGLLERSVTRLLSARRLDETLWEVRFKTEDTGETYRVVLSREMNGAERVVSCSPMKAKLVAQFRLISYGKVRAPG